LKDTNNIVVLVLDRAAQDGIGLVSRLTVVGWVEAGVGVSIFDVTNYTCLCNGPSDALMLEDWLVSKYLTAKGWNRKKKPFPSLGAGELGD